MSTLKLYDLFDQLDRAGNKEQLWQAIFSAFAQLGCERLFFIEKRQAHLSPFMLSNFPREFKDFYRREQAIHIDPFVQISLTKSRPMYTGMHFLDDYAGISKEGIIFALDAAEAGLNFGLSIPLVSTNHNTFGGWNVGGDLSCQAARLHLSQHESDLQLLAYYAHHCLMKQQRPKILLSPREYDCLSYMAQGFTNQQIAERLFLSESTIQYHLRKAREKLGAKNREHAIAIAVKYQLINPDMITSSITKKVP